MFFNWVLVLNIVSARKDLGPLVSVCARMGRDMIKFGAIWIVLLLAFSCAMHGTGVNDMPSRLLLCVSHASALSFSFYMCDMPICYISLLWRTCLCHLARSLARLIECARVRVCFLPFIFVIFILAPSLFLLIFLFLSLPFFFSLSRFPSVFPCLFLALALALFF